MSEIHPNRYERSPAEENIYQRAERLNRENKQLRQQLGQAQADRDKHRDALESIEWLILRKQAEAVEAAANDNRLKGQRHEDYVLYDDLIMDVEQMRNKADELEQNQ